MVIDEDYEDWVFYEIKMDLQAVLSKHDRLWSEFQDKHYSKVVWCIENFGLEDFKAGAIDEGYTDPYYTGYRFYFKNEEDFMAFKLKWI